MLAVLSAIRLRDKTPKIFGCSEYNWVKIPGYTTMFFHEYETTLWLPILLYWIMKMAESYSVWKCTCYILTCHKNYPFDPLLEPPQKLLTRIYNKSSNKEKFWEARCLTCLNIVTKQRHQEKEAPGKLDANFTPSPPTPEK